MITYNHEHTPEGYTPCSKEAGHEGPCYVLGKLSRVDIAEKARDMGFYNKGKEDGQHSAKCRVAIELVNIYYDTSLKWWHWRKRNSRIKQYIDQLWQEYGPDYEDDE